MKNEIKVNFITDPCYIMGNDYDKLGKKMKWEMERAKFPYKCKNGVIIKKILGTPSGDGLFSTPKGTIAVDSGQLCLAEMSLEKANKEKWGVKASPDCWESNRELYYFLSKF